VLPLGRPGQPESEILVVAEDDFGIAAAGRLSAGLAVENELQHDARLRSARPVGGPRGQRA
jgi:hypothetical protein